MKRIAWLCGLALPLWAGANEIPPLVLPAGVGVNIHFVGGHARDLDMIRAGGFSFVRMDFAWDATEREAGRYEWSGYEQLLQHLEARDLRAILVLDYSNPLYEETVTSPDPLKQFPRKTTASPRHPASVAAFARWAAAAATHFRGRHVIWEVWNEPNGDFWSPRPNAAEYSRLAVATCAALRAADPEATIIGPASSGFPWEYLETFLKSGVLDYLDAVSVHPYRDPRHPPETAAADYQKLRRLLETCQPPARKGTIPIFSGEWGYASHERGVTLQTQADFAVRQQLANLLAGIPLSIWYDWKNDGDDPRDNEQNFGTVRSDLTPKPAYLAIQKMTRELAGYRIVRRLEVPDHDDYVLLFSGANRGESKLAAWTLGAPHSVELDKRLLASEIPPTAAPSSIRIDLTSSPLYVALSVARR